MNFYSAAADRNRQAILDALITYLASIDKVLEIGSGTGQHADYFSQSLSSLTWQPSDQGEYLNELRSNLKSICRDNLPDPLEIDVNTNTWKEGSANFDAIFSANTLHIMDIKTCKNFLGRASNYLSENGYLFLYGPFKYNGEFTSASNADFDTSLKQRKFGDGIKDFEWVRGTLTPQGFDLLKDIKMPANNQLLIWQLSNLSD